MLSSGYSEQDRRASANRDTPAELRRKSALLDGTPLIQAMIDAMSSAVLILNNNRQIIAANRAFLELLKLTRADVVGKRMGEVMGCPNWRQGFDGCGTAPQCAACGGNQAILASRSTGQSAIGHWDWIVDQPLRGVALELRVKATPAVIEREEFTVLDLEDVTTRKRLDDLSRIFFHDALNLLNGMQGHASLLCRRLAGSESVSDAQRLRWIMDQLIDEIEAQRDLTLAETGRLEVEPQPLRTGVLLNDLCELYRHHPSGDGRTIRLADAWDGVIVSDVRLLGRVLGNMLRNALEATEPGGQITVHCGLSAEQVMFSVHNAGVIPDAIQAQLFRRACSTKGRSRRGAGTRSMKLLGEQYLKGSIGFVSNAADGTTFTLRIPKALVSVAGE